MIIDKEDLQRDRTAKEIAERFGVCDKTVGIGNYLQGEKE